MLRRLAAAPLLVAALVAAGCATRAEGLRAPAVQGETWLQAKGTGDTVTDGKWSLVVMFRPEAPACLEGMAAVKDLQAQFGPRGLTVIGVTAADRETTAQYLKENGITFPVLVNAQNVIDAFGIPDVARNHTYLLDPPGVVVAQSDLDTTHFYLDRYLKPRSGPMGDYRRTQLRASR